MLQEITIKNFKSIAEDTIELGRVNVFIGENGCGKSNILEAVGFASASLISSNIDKEILMNKGVRIAKPSLMVSAFSKKQNPEISLDLKFDDNKNLSVRTTADNDDIHNAKWLGNNNAYYEKIIIEEFDLQLKEFKREAQEELQKIVLKELGSIEEIPAEINKKIEQLINESAINLNHEITTKVMNKIAKETPHLQLSDFVIYALNTPALRGFTDESKRDPVGIYGEYLDTLINSFDKAEKKELIKYNYLIDWLKNFDIDQDDIRKLEGYKLNRSKSKLYFSDKYIKNKDKYFSSENANEGILHVLFYLAVMISKRTPKFFAIDNIESCLNPHLCRHLMEQLCVLAKENDKQLLITTHNPAILDGLNLFDEEIRLFEVSRNRFGHTVTERIKVKPEHEQKEGRRLKLSELWTRGYLGAISKQF